MIKYILIALFSGIISSFAQVLLKIGAEKGYLSFRQYVNIYVISGYGLTLLCMLLTIVAYRGIPYKLGPVLETLTYLYILVISRIVFGEKITRQKLIGSICIVIGVITFNLQ